MGKDASSTASILTKFYLRSGFSRRGITNMFRSLLTPITMNTDRCTSVLGWVVFGVLLSAPQWAQAHAHLTAASPAVDSTVPTAPHEVSITYTEGVEPKFSTIEVLNAAGARVDTADVHTAPDDNKRLSVSVKPLPPGVYQVIWHATAVDTHKTQGHFSFTVSQ